MLELQRITTADTALYQFMENLMKQAFPTAEYRDLDELRLYTDTKVHFYNNIIMEENRPIGFFTYWDFDTFYYAEHFAIEAEKRCGGIGGHCLSRFLEHVAKPVVLEVEMPTNDFSRRRIGFYERLGFTLDSHYYIQPPYHDGGESLELQLMTYNYPLTDELFESVKRILYREVYKVKD